MFRESWQLMRLIQHGFCNFDVIQHSLFCRELFGFVVTENGKIKIVKPENGANIDRKYAGELTNKFYKRKNVGKSNQEQVEIPNF